MDFSLWDSVEDNREICSLVLVHRVSSDLVRSIAAVVDVDVSITGEFWVECDA